MAIVNDFEETKVVTQAVAQVEQPDPENVVVLSTGVKVKFIKPLPANIAQQIVISSFNDINVDSTGRVKDNMSSQEQLATAKKMYDFNAALLIQGLSRDCLSVYPSLPTDTKWLHRAKLNPLVQTAHPHIDFGDKLDQEFLYLFYEGFVSETDYQVLADKMLNR